MDRNTVIGFVLIFILLMGWIYTTAPDPEVIEQQRIERQMQDSLRALQAQAEQEEDIEVDHDPVPEERGVFSAEAADTLVTIVSTPRYTVHFTNIGAGPKRYFLDNYATWDGGTVQLIADSTKSTYSLGFISSENYFIETNTLAFNPINYQEVVEIDEGGQAVVQYELLLDNDKRLIYTYTFTGDSYEYGLNIRFDGVEQYITGRNIEFTWTSALNATEQSRASEAMYTAGYSKAGGVLEEFQPSEGYSESLISGNIDWVASKSKFFTQLIKPTEETDGATLTAEISGDPSEEATIHTYTTGLRSRISDDNVMNYRLYVGPLDLYELRDFDRSAYDMVDTGFRFMTWFSDPFVKWAIVPFFKTVGGATGNIGITIIIFAFLVKIVLYPLTKKSFESMAAMREIQPEMKALQEKYKDNPQKQQEATLKLFKKAKVNPLGSCLPNLLQFPVLITFWRFFQNSIELRQEAFLWAPDLASPDVILNLPFTIPFMGSHIAGFVLLMTASMVVQMKISGQAAATGGANPMMKVFQYVLPVMLLFIFNTLSSGLSLYYLIYNTLSIGQQMLINKQIDHVSLMESVDKKKAKEMRKEKLLEEKRKKKEAKEKNS